MLRRNLCKYNITNPQFWENTFQMHQFLLFLSDVMKAKPWTIIQEEGVKKGLLQILFPQNYKHIEIQYKYKYQNKKNR